MAEVTVCFDLDGVLCNQTAGDYENATPNLEAIALVNDLHASGVRIIIHTSRFMGRAKEDPGEARRLGLDFTIAQLSRWGVRYDELFMGKPRYDVVVDDRALFYEENWARIREHLTQFVDRKRRAAGLPGQ
ncbi:MAG: hypothetical protein JOZ69_11330 [Myxococcales bacterium]|nr:hypothetical protein [Myxococcales bacterium]